MWLDFVNLFKKKRKYREENLLFSENYRINAGLSRYCKGLSIVELVEHSFMRNLIMSNIIVNYIHKNKLFLVVVCDLFATYKGVEKNCISV